MGACAYCVKRTDRFALRSEARIETRGTSPFDHRYGIASLFGAKRGLKLVELRKFGLAAVIASLFGAKRGLKLIECFDGGALFRIASLFGAKRGLKP